MSDIVADSVQVHIVRFNPSSGEAEYLSIRRSDRSEIYPSIWQVITGWIEVGETAVQTALRELNEETHLTPVRMWTLPYIAHFFNSRNDTVQAAPIFGMIVNFNDKVELSIEHSDFKWLNYEETLDLLDLPTHQRGTRIFRDYIIYSNDLKRFEIDIRKYIAEK